MSMKKIIALATAGCLLVSRTAFAASQDKLTVKGSDQDVSNGTVTASEVMAAANGWLVIHRTTAEHKPGPVIGYSPLKKGMNTNVTAILQEPVKKGEMLMLMLHGEDGGTKTGVFEYTLGAKEDGPVKVDGKLVMTVISAN